MLIQTDQCALKNVEMALTLEITNARMAITKMAMVVINIAESKQVTSA